MAKTRLTSPRAGTPPVARRKPPKSPKAGPRAVGRKARHAPAPAQGTGESWSPDALMRRLRAGEPDRSSHGCEHCRLQIAQREPELTTALTVKDARALFGGLAVRPAGTVSYQSVNVLTCTRCRAAWLSYFEEVEDANTTMSEWGHTLHLTLPLSDAEQVALLNMSETVAAYEDQKKQDTLAFFFGDSWDGAKENAKKG